MIGLTTVWCEHGHNGFSPYICQLWWRFQRSISIFFFLSASFLFLTRGLPDLEFSSTIIHAAASLVRASLVSLTFLLIKIVTRDLKSNFCCLIFTVISLGTSHFLDIYHHMIWTSRYRILDIDELVIRGDHDHHTVRILDMMIISIEILLTLLVYGQRILCL